MATNTLQTNVALFDFVLSREEVQVILRLIEAPYLPMLGDDPVPNLTAEQIAYGLIVAERALRAKGIAFIDDEQRLRVQKEVLEGIAYCAFASQTMTTTFVSLPTAQGVRFVAFAGADNKWVLHTSPQGGVHRFRIYATMMDVLAEIWSVYATPAIEPQESWRFSIDSGQLQQVQICIRDQTEPHAFDLLLAAGARDDEAAELVDLLRGPHLMGICQVTERLDGNSLGIKSVTVLMNQNSLISAIEPEFDDETSVTLLQKTNLVNVLRAISGSPLP